MDISFFKGKKILLALLFFIFLGYLWLVWQPIETLLSGPLVDDAFYYFKTASNISNGLGPTFDGEHLTNGYHPLWMGINVLIYYLIPDNKISPIHIVLSLSVLLYLATTFLIWKIISRWLPNGCMQALLILFYVLNPWNATIYLNGLETPLALFLLVLLFSIFLNILEKNSDRLKDFTILGVLAGLLILSRLDYGLFVSAIFLYFLWRGGFLWKPLWAFAVPAAVISAPWFLYNYFYFGSFIPASGLSYTLVNHKLWFYKDRSLTQILFWSLHNFLGTIVFNLRTVGIPAYYSGLDLAGSFRSLTTISAPIILAVSYFYIHGKERFKDFLKEIFHSFIGQAFLIFSAAFIGLIIVHGAIRWSGREWYFASFIFLAVIFLTIILGRKELIHYTKTIVIVLGILLAISFSYSWGNFPRQNANQLEMYQTAKWVNSFLPVNARFAAFNSGIMGYFSGRFLMNSDGLINNAAYESLKKNNLWEFFEKERIDYIADYEITLSYRFKPFLGINNPLERVREIDLPADIDRSGNYGGSHIKIYKLLKNRFNV